LLLVLVLLLGLSLEPLAGVDTAAPEVPELGVTTEAGALALFPPPPQAARLISSAVTPRRISALMPGFFLLGTVVLP
jgi:hypothetical protein